MILNGIVIKKVTILAMTEHELCITLSNQLPFTRGLIFRPQKGKSEELLTQKQGLASAF